MSIEFKNNLVLVWLTNEDQENPLSLQAVELIKEHFTSKKNKIVVYCSGKDDLVECTKHLLARNKQLFSK